MYRRPILRRFAVAASASAAAAVAAVAAVGIALTACPVNAQEKETPPTPAASKAAQVRFDLRLVRSDSGNPAAVVLGTPIITTLDGSTASASITGAEPSYMVSLSPTLEKSGETVAVLWNLRLSGKGLPGVTAASLSGASRIPQNKESLLAEISLKDPASGKTSRFQVFVKASVSDAALPQAGSGSTP